MKGYRHGLQWALLLFATASLEAAPPPEWERDFAVRLQVYLDREGFPPGHIDGRPGDFTHKAVQNLIQARGWNDGLGPEFVAGLTAVDPLYVEYEVRDADRRFIGTVASARAAQARQSRMPYVSLLELVSERYHASPVLVEELNPGRSLHRLTPGDRVIVPNVGPFEIEKLRASVENRPPQPPFRIETNRLEVSLSEKLVRVFDEEDRLLAAYPITPGANNPGMRTPRGQWQVANVVVYPNFRYDHSMLKTGKRSDNYHMIPPGPNNPVGVCWIGLNRSGIGFHGTDNPRTIGRAVSHGCIRLSNWDVLRLRTFVHPGTPVLIEE